MMVQDEFFVYIFTGSKYSLDEEFVLLCGYNFLREKWSKTIDVGKFFFVLRDFSSVKKRVLFWSF